MIDESKVETTLFSLKKGAPQEEDGDDRRSGTRHLTLFRVGSLIVDGRRELCLIKNISDGGMMVRAYCDLEPDMMLSIELKHGERIDGRVSWVKDRNVGIAFDTPIDVLAILSGSEGGPRPRMPRIEIDCPVILYDKRQRIEARAIDVSQGGIKVSTAQPLGIKDDIAVTLPGLAPEAGIVCWCEDDHVGITFNRLIPLSSLIGWLHELRDGVRRAG